MLLENIRADDGFRSFNASKIFWIWSNLERAAVTMPEGAANLINLQCSATAYNWYHWGETLQVKPREKSEQPTKSTLNCKLSNVWGPSMPLSIRYRLTPTGSTRYEKNKNSALIPGTIELRRIWCGQCKMHKNLQFFQAVEKHPHHVKRQAK